MRVLPSVGQHHLDFHWVPDLYISHLWKPFGLVKLHSPTLSVPTDKLRCGMIAKAVVPQKFQHFTVPKVFLSQPRINSDEPWSPPYPGRHEVLGNTTVAVSCYPRNMDHHVGAQQLQCHTWRFILQPGSWWWHYRWNTSSMAPNQLSQETARHPPVRQKAGWHGHS